MFKRSIQLAVFACLVTRTLWAADNPFVGEWKLNTSKSKLTDQMKVEKVGANKYAFDFEGDGDAETIMVDGTDQPGADGTTLAVTAESPNAWKVVRKKDGRVIIIGNWKLSKDGNTLTDNFNGVSPDGKTSTVDYIYQRRAGGPGFAGTWVSTSETVNFVLVLKIRPYEGDGLSISNSQGGTTNTKLDGKEYPFGDAKAPSGFSSGRRLDEHTVELTRKKADSKISDVREIQLSSDLKTLTMTTHATGRIDPQILVFERQ